MNKQLSIEKQADHYVLTEQSSKEFYSQINNEQTPCDGCIHADNCGHNKLACNAFALYVNNGSVNWEIPRKPTRRTYARIMWFDDKSLIREINKELRERV